MAIRNNQNVRYINVLIAKDCNKVICFVKYLTLILILSYYL